MNDMLTKLRRITQLVGAAQDLPSALTLLVDKVNESINAQATSVFLVDAVNGEYILAATHGLNVDCVGKVRLPLGEGLVGLIGEREEPINLENAQMDGHFYALPELAEEALHGFLGVPIIQQGELLGVIVAQQYEPAPFPEEEEAFLVTLSTQLSVVIAQAIAKGALQLLNQKGRRRKTDTVLTGVCGATGVAIGHAVVVYPPADLEAVPDRIIEDIDFEIELFEEALSQAREEIQQIQERARAILSVGEQALFDAYLRLLDSRSLMSEMEDEIRQGQWAQGALKRVIHRHVMQFEAFDDLYLRERASDFKDLGRRILAYLQSHKRQQIEYVKDTILVSDEITATMLMEVPQERLYGIISGSGSSNSHVAILARALGVPTVMGVTGMPLTELAGREIIVDGYQGQAYLSPTAALKKEFKALAKEEEALDAELAELQDLPATTQDHHTVALYVNTGLAVDGGLSLSVGAEGVGLYRTELPFMLRDRFPSEEEQRIMYRQLLNIFAPRPVIMRTLDIGGDKTLPYFPVEEANPFLGWRGIRITLDHPEIFLQQVRAMLQASEGLNNLSIMLPMISSVLEVDEALRLIQQAFDEVREEGLKIKKPAIGLMIEVPAAVYQTRELARRVDFISVGSNDLIQYLLAVDRNNPKVAHLYNSLHPAVLRALQQIVSLAKKAKRPVSLCGELASDPLVAVLLLGMGFNSLSMSARSLPKIKWVIRHFSLVQAKELVKEVLLMDNAVEIRGFMEAALDAAGLGVLIRVGKPG